MKLFFSPMDHLPHHQRQLPIEPALGVWLSVSDTVLDQQKTLGICLSHVRHVFSVSRGRAYLLHVSIWIWIGYNQWKRWRCSGIRLLHDHPQTPVHRLRQPAQDGCYMEPDSSRAVRPDVPEKLLPGHHRMHPLRDMRSGQARHRGVYPRTQFSVLRLSSGVLLPKQLHPAHVSGWLLLPRWNFYAYPVWHRELLCRWGCYSITVHYRLFLR